MNEDGSQQPTIQQMLNSPRFYVAVVALAALLSVVAVLGGRGGFRSTGTSLPPTTRVDRIAYVSLDARVHSVNPDGSDPVQISPDEGFFTWPTWSPDARSLVFSSVVRGSDGISSISLLSADTASSELDEIYVGEPGIIGLLAEGVVHYPLWSPDSDSVAFIAVTSRGLTLFVDDLRDDDGADPILDQGPLWISWSPDSRYLLAHRGTNHYLVDTRGDTTVSQLDIRSAAYRVPAWRPTGETVTIAAQDEIGREFLVAANLSGDMLTSKERLIDVASNPAFLWSPDGRFLAVGREPRFLLTDGGVVLVNQKLTILPGGDPENALEVDDQVVAHFWSPDSARIAYVTITESRSMLRWMMLDVQTGERWPLIDFEPSQDQLTMLQFFDQYAYSHSLWSPDSKALVFSGVLDTGTVTASYSGLPEHIEPHIIVVGVDPNPSARFIADGILAFWSPR